MGITSFDPRQLPTGRKVLLVPDNDQTDSAAHKVFRKAIANLLANGIDVQIARDLNGSK